MTEEECKKDFVKRCMVLRGQIQCFFMFEPNSRVITSVLCEFIREIVQNQKDSQGALNQVIHLLKMNDSQYFEEK